MAFNAEEKQPSSTKSRSKRDQPRKGGSIILCYLNEYIAELRQ